MKKLIGVCLLLLACFQGIAQTDKYTEKLQKLYSAGDYYKVIDYKSGNEGEMSAVSLYIKGSACFQVANYRRAISYFDRAIEKGDPLADYYYYKGACHLLLDQYDESVAALTKAVEMESDEVNYLSLLATAYYYQENYADAALWYEKAVALEKDNEQVFAFLGDCYVELKQYDKAVTAYENSYETASKFKDRKYAHYHMAESQYLAGDYAGAKATLAEHMKDFKGDYDAVSLLIQVHNALNEGAEVKPLETKMNESKKEDLAFPKSMSKMYCIDRFNVQSNAVKVYQAYTDQSYQIYLWRHQFVVSDEAGEELYTLETQWDSTVGNDNAYTFCKAQGDSLFKYESVTYGENFDYFQFRQTAQRIIAGEIAPVEVVTGYEDWLAKKKSARNGGTGESFESAIMIESVPAEYAYLRENYPGYTFMMQSLVFHEGVPYDILRIKTKDEGEMDVYFNISSFFGKY